MSKPSRGVPFTPMKRTHSHLSMKTDENMAPSLAPPASMARYPSTVRAPTPVGSNSPPKKIRAALSIESRPRSTVGNYPRPVSVLANAPITPKKNGTPRRNGNDSMNDLNATPDIPSDPEEGLVDFQNVEVDPDASIDMDDVFGGRLNPDTKEQKEDKVLVSIRYNIFCKW